MPQPAATEFVADRVEAFGMARRKAIKGHRTWLLFRRKDGQFEGRLYSASAIKAALLAGGTRGRFHWIDSGGISHVCCSWDYGVHLFRCARGAERKGYSLAA